MKPSLLALSLALALGTLSAQAADTTPPTNPSASVTSASVAGDSTNTDGTVDHGSRNKQASKDAKNLSAVDVTAVLDQSRNSLSPDTGSSQYVIDQKAIEQLPLGASTPINQVLLQAPGVVQDSFGGIHVRGDHANLQYRINGVIIPESISGFGQALDARTIQNVKLLDGALPAQYGDRTAAVVDITTKSGHDLGNGGSVGVTTGSFGTFNPNASIWGSNDRWSYFLTANYMESDVGIENPTASRTPIHDHTNQVKAFGDVSYLINNDTRLSFLFGVSNNRFQIPNNPGQTPKYGYLDTVDFNSADLNEQQNEKTRFGVLALQGKFADTDYQVSVGRRYTSVGFSPDDVGDLIFNGVAATINRSNVASTLQADFSTPLGDSNTLRYGLYGSFERAVSGNNSLVFPADADGNQTSTVPFNIFDASHIVAKTYAAYLQDEWSISDKLTMNYGLRADEYQAFRTESQLSPRLGLVYQATDSTTLHAGYSRYFTPPDFELVSASTVTRFNGTTNQSEVTQDSPVQPERSDYFDIGVTQRLTPALTVGLDAYYKIARNLLDEGQFGTALIYTPFNYQYGRVYGLEFTTNYKQGNVSAYLNVAYSKAQGKDVDSAQFNFSAAELAYIANNWVYLDHDQRVTVSLGGAYDLGKTTFTADALVGSGLRSGFANTDKLPWYGQLNLAVIQHFNEPIVGKFEARVVLINAINSVYELRDGSGIGVEAPQYGPQRAIYAGITKRF